MNEQNTDSALERHRSLTAAEAIERARQIIAHQPNVRNEAKWADAYYDIALLIGRVQIDASGGLGVSGD